MTVFMHSDGYSYIVVVFSFNVCAMVLRNCCSISQINNIIVDLFSSNNYILAVLCTAMHNMACAFNSL